MAKRAPSDEKPFRPLDASVLRSVVQHVAESAASAPPPPVPPGVTPRPWPTPHREAEAKPPVMTLVPQLTRLDQEKRILYTREEAHALDRLVSNLAVRLNTQVKVSHVLRALTSLLLRAEKEIDQRAGEHGPLVRPSNGDFAALQRFEQEVATIFAHALRDAGAF